jgi:hypothetical protein
MRNSNPSYRLNARAFIAALGACIAFAVSAFAEDPIAAKARPDGWGKEKYGYETQLVPAQESFALGAPIPLHLLLKNVSSAAKSFDKQGTFNRCLTVLKDDGSQVNYKGAEGQTFGGPEDLASGAVAVVFDNRDINKEFAFTEPGRYRAYFEEGRYSSEGDSIFPQSNMLELNITAGTVPPQNALLLKILPRLPGKYWTISEDSYVPKEVLESNADAVSLTVTREARLISDLVMARVVLSATPGKCVSGPPPAATPACVKSFSKPPPQYCEALGQFLGRDVYLIFDPCVLKEWPAIDADLRAAIK